MARTFKGGIYAVDHKRLTRGPAIELLPPVKELVLPLALRPDAPCQPIVSVGQRVLLGQQIAEAVSPRSAPLHASVSGTVTAIEPRPDVYGGETMSIVIENDLLDEPDPAIRPADVDSLTAEEALELLARSGIVCHGNQGLPTAAKLAAARGRADTILLNGAESEPYLTSDHRILLEYPWEVIGGGSLLSRILGVRRVILGVEANKQDAFPKLRECLPQDGSVQLCSLVSKYPQGMERQLTESLTGRSIPSGKGPLDAGCVVFNIDTAAAVYRLFTGGMPDIRRIVTVSGSAVANPKNLECRIGTPVEALIDACGGFLEPPTRLILGGPMMGLPQTRLDIPVLKTTGGFLAFGQEEERDSEMPACIRCGRCVEACPQQLIPLSLSRLGERGRLSLLRDYRILDCTECGACQYVCPGKMPLMQNIRRGKQRVMDARKQK